MRSKIYNSRDVRIPHSDLVKLRRNGKVALGIHEFVADHRSDLSAAA